MIKKDIKNNENKPSLPAHMCEHKKSTDRVSGSTYSWSETGYPKN